MTSTLRCVQEADSEKLQAVTLEVVDVRAQAVAKTTTTVARAAMWSLVSE